MQVIQFIQDEMERQRGSFFLWTPVALGLGIAAYFALPFEPILLPSVCFTLALLLLAMALRENGLWRRIFILLFCAALGFSLSIAHTRSVYTPILQEEIGPVDIRGTLQELEPLEGWKGMRGILRDLEIERLSPEETPRTIRLKLRADENLAIGQRIEVLASLNPPSPPVVPGGFDFQRYSYFQGLGGIGFAYKKAVILDHASPHRFWDWIEDVRFAIGARVNAALPAAEAAIANALITGPRAAISEEDNDAIRDAGLAHMLSISGLHISLLFGVIFFMVRMVMAFFPSLALHHPIKKYAAVLAMAGAIFYTLISGCSVPTLRSIFMMGVVFLAIMFDRKAFSTRLVAFAALVVLVISPDALLGVSFQLSFAAVTALIVFFEDFQPVMTYLTGDAGWIRRIFLYLLGICLTSVIATFATAPFTLFHFQQIALYSVLGNVLAVPVLGFIVMPFAILAFLLMPFGLEGFVFPVIGFGVEIILRISHWVAGLEGAVFRAPQWPFEALLFFAIAFLLAVLLKGYARLVFIVPLMISMLYVAASATPDILVSANAKMMAVKLEDGSLAFSDMRKERFARENFLRSLGLPQEVGQRWPKEGRLGALSCDPKACRMERNGYKISFLKAKDVTQEECAWADVVVAPFGVKACKAEAVVDYFYVQAHGAAAVTLDKDVRVVNAEQDRPLRPWNARYQKLMIEKDP